MPAPCRRAALPEPSMNAPLPASSALTTSAERLWSTLMSLATIGAETERVLGSDRYRVAAEAVAAEMQSHPPAASFLDAL